MNTKAIIVLIGAIVVVGAVVLVSTADLSRYFPTQGETNKPADKTLVLRIGEAKSGYGISLKPEQVVEDSRCPVDVQCIQAGTVRVGVLITQGSDQSLQTLELGKPFILIGGTLTLTAVTPEAHSEQPITPTDYQFTFTVNSSTATE